MFDVTLVGLLEVEQWLAALPDQLNSQLVAKSQELSDALVAKIQDALNGDVLQSKTGMLRDSVIGNVQSDGTIVATTVSAGDGVPYAAIQEYGGTTKAHIIEAINGKALAFAWQGKNVFFPHVNHPGSVIPERSYMRSSFTDMQDDIPAGMEDALQTTIQS